MLAATPMSPPRLAPLFRAHLPAAPPDEYPELERRLAGLLDAARAAWPEIKLDEARFLEHLARKLGGGDWAQALERVHGEDLYLACACSLGDPRALSAFAREIEPKLEQALIRQASARALADEVLQLVREKLFIARDGQPPRIADFSGRGPLLHWARAVASRTLLDLKRARRDDVPLDEKLSDELPLESTDPELAAVRAKDRPHFDAAFRAALATLSPRQRTLLRLHIVEGLSFEQIGRLHRVHRSTALRWIASAREAVLAELRRRLVESLGLRRSELDSVMRQLRSQLQVSLSPLLQEEDGP